MKARIPLTALALLAVAAVAPGLALGADLRNAPATPEVVLPGAVSASAARADPRTWIVGVRAGSRAARRIARAHGGRPIAGAAWLAPRSRARALAAALRVRDLLEYAEPNRIGHRAQAPAPDPLSPQAAWRDFVVGGQVPPPVTLASPLIAVVDTQIDAAHPEIAGSNIRPGTGFPVSDDHGTATSTVAAAPANKVGMLGIWPGARVLGVTLPDGERITCADSARGIAAAVKARAAVINMSYGSPSRCITEEQQIQRAVRAGAVPVAASGNEGELGSPLEYPASLAHVLTVGAIDADGEPTLFSNESAAVDLAAPGIGILTGVPATFDSDGAAHGLGFAYVNGTSFAAPMVSAAVAWVRAARPQLSQGQAAQVVRLGARDVGRPGYEKATGFGVLDLGGALGLPAPVDDPLEPNDDIRYVDGRFFAGAAPPLHNGRRPRSLTAVTDVAEDPIDVYRVRVRAGRRLRLALLPKLGDPDLFVFGANARSVSRQRQVAGSSLSGSRIDRVSVRNRGRRTATFYVAVGFSSRKSRTLLNATYELRAR